MEKLNKKMDRKFKSIAIGYDKKNNKNIHTDILINSVV